MAHRKIVNCAIFVFAYPATTELVVYNRMGGEFKWNCPFLKEIVLSYLLWWLEFIWMPWTAHEK